MDTQSKRISFYREPLVHEINGFYTLQRCPICDFKARYAIVVRQGWFESGEVTGARGIAEYICASEECFNLWLLQQPYTS